MAIGTGCANGLPPVGGDDLPDYELLELLLFQIIPRRDVKPLAKQMIARFGSFAETLAAPVEHLQDFAGMGETSALALKAIYAAAKRMGKSDRSSTRRY
jgi:DNA repair protein RadC